MTSKTPQNSSPDPDDKDAVKPPSHSVLAALQSRIQSKLGVHIDSQGPDDIPVRITDEAKALRDPTGRYQILGEVGRGGVGVVYKGRDTDLGRDVAMKVLRDEYADHPEVLARFVEEAQIGGQLQHPGIVPVYELGLQSGERPYFAMKLVKGETLSAELAKRGDPNEDRRRFYGVFEQICQTMAYAHSRNVVHRDLKPANVMIGAFGEVQVVDWGFAKVLQKGGNADEKASIRNSSAESVISTVRSTPGSGTQSVVGSMLGTPAYMPPEQALGDLEHLDARSDVFGLGAILCEVLTGEPPYREQDGDVVCQAAAAKLEPVHERLRLCGADEAMVTLCIECLSRTRQARPGSAQELADRVSAYLTSVEDRARQAELRATEARFKQRTTLLSAAAALLILVIGGVAWSWIETEARNQRQATTDRITAATSDLREARGRAQAAVLDLELWITMLEDASRLEHIATVEKVNDEDRQAASELIVAARAEYNAAVIKIGLLKRDSEMRKQLITARIPTDDDIRSGSFAAKERQRLNDAYRTAFSLYLGKSVAEVSTEEALTSMRSGGMPIELAASLDHFCMVRDGLEDQNNSQALTARIREMATLLDSGNTWRTELRRLLPSAKKQAVRVRELASQADFAELTAAHCQVLAIALQEAGEYQEAISVLRRAREQHPQDFGLAFALAAGLETLETPDWSSVSASLDVARAIAPEQNEVLHRQGMALEQLGRLADAERVFRILVSRDGENAHWLKHLSIALFTQGKLNEAIESFRQEIEAAPDSVDSHINLGIALEDQGMLDEAIESFRRAIKLGSTETHYSLGLALSRQGKLDEAIATFRLAIEADPDDHEAQYSLGNAYKAQGKLDEAIASYQLAIKSNQDYAEAHCYLGLALKDQGKLDEAIDCYRRAIKARAGLAPAHFNLAEALKTQGKLNDAIASYRNAIAIWSTRNDAFSIEWAGKAETSIETLQRTPKLLAIVRGEKQAASAQEWLDAADLAYEQKDYLGSAQTYTRGFAAFPETSNEASHFYNASCAAALAASGKGEAAKKLTAIVQAGLRTQAYGWLVANLKRWAVSEGAAPQNRTLAIRNLQHWQRDSDLASIRDEQALTLLSDEEAATWRALWIDVAKTLKHWQESK